MFRSWEVQKWIPARTSECWHEMSSICFKTCDSSNKFCFTAQWKTYNFAISPHVATINNLYINHLMIKITECISDRREFWFKRFIICLHCVTHMWVQLLHVLMHVFRLPANRKHHRKYFLKWYVSVGNCQGVFVCNAYTLGVILHNWFHACNYAHQLSWVTLLLWLCKYTRAECEMDHDMQHLGINDRLLVIYYYFIIIKSHWYSLSFNETEHHIHLISVIMIERLRSNASHFYCHLLCY